MISGSQLLPFGLKEVKVVKAIEEQGMNLLFVVIRPM
jgi:hypothetical protein